MEWFVFVNNFKFVSRFGFISSYDLSMVSSSSS